MNVIEVHSHHPIQKKTGTSKLPGVSSSASENTAKIAKGFRIKKKKSSFINEAVGKKENAILYTIKAAVQKTINILHTKRNFYYHKNYIEKI